LAASALLRLAPKLALERLVLDDAARGAAGERLVARRLARAGWRVLARRLVMREHEIDLVAREGAVLVCVEVKTGRPGPRYRPGARLRADDLCGLRRCARALARRHGLAAWRVDLVEVLLEPRVRVRHHRDLARPLGRAPRANDPNGGLPPEAGIVPAR
jgi:putative endonuclease